MDFFRNKYQSLSSWVNVKKKVANSTCPPCKWRQLSKAVAKNKKMEASEKTKFEYLRRLQI